MDAHRIHMLVAAHAKADESYLVLATVRADVNGRPVRIEVTDTGEPEPYRYNASVYDGKTSEFLAAGNGAEDVDTALSIVHWGDVRA